MEIRAIRTPVIESGTDLAVFVPEHLPDPLQDGDILCVTSKIVALSQGRHVRLSAVVPGLAAQAAANRHISPQLAQVILDEADQAYPVPGPFWLTIKDNIFIANAGVDLSNAPADTAILWPDRVWAWAAELRRRLLAHYPDITRLGVVVVDSHLTPLRRGVTGVALAFAGFEGVQKQVGAPDLYGRPLEATYQSTADGLASAAVLLMGEGAEQTPLAWVRGAPVCFTDRAIDPAEAVIDPAQDLFAVLLQG